MARKRRNAGPLGFGPRPDGLPRPMGTLGYAQSSIEIRLVGGDERQGVLHIKTPALMTGESTVRPIRRNA